MRRSVMLAFMRATRSTIGFVLALAGLAGLFPGCSTTEVVVPPPEAPGPLPVGLERYAEAGDFPVGVMSGELRSAYGCLVRYEVHEPLTEAPGQEEPAPGNGTPSAPPTVILGHGFLRSLDAMRGWAQLWASHGVRTVVVSFCNSSIFDGRHDRNAADMVAVATAVLEDGPDGAAAPVIYAGFSAGGLSALLAAASDPRTVAYLGLDAVDSGELAATVTALPRALFLFGEPSPCNADGNMVGTAGSLQTGHSGAPEATVVLRIPFATHCDFENPYDDGCERLCGAVEPPQTAEEIRTTIRAVATAWLLEIAARPGNQAQALRQSVARLEQSRRVIRLDSPTAGRTN